jgi:tripartite-type tricarboxylate transporter receptor subunit TctC
MRGSKRLFCIGLISALILVFLALTGVSQAEKKYPTRAIDIIVPFAPGASTDLSTRIVADFCKRKWHVPVNVLNKPGGNTIPALLEVYNAAPDGYTMFSENQNSASMLAVIFTDLPFRIMDRTFIAMTITTPLIIIVPSGSAVKSIKDLEAEAKKDPENFTWTSLGGTSTQDVTSLQFLKAIGVDVSKTKPIISTGGSVAVTQTAGGHVKMGVGTSSGALPAIKSGLVKPLGITTKTRFPDLPDVPTFTELGYPSIDCTMWVGVSGPPRLPTDVVEAWTEALREMSKDPKYIEQMTRIGATIRYLGPHELKEFILKEIEDLKTLGLKKKK